MAMYIYTPLDSTNEQIRLIHLLPGCFQDDIKVEMFHAQLALDEDSDSTTISYDALSYVWGSAENLKSITIVGTCTNPRSGQLPVTENLAVALRHLRKQHEIRTLWIDAICINQKDLTERSTEVGNMGKIYKKACRTLVWLGPEEENSSLAAHLLQSIPKDVYQRAACWMIRPRSETYEKIYSLDKFTSSKASWVAFSKLCCRPWFSRLWVYQELHLSKVATAVVGLLEFNIKDLSKIVRAVRSMALQGNSITDLFGNNESRIEVAQNLLRPLSSTTNILKMTSDLRCLDPKDRVYAILGLISENACNPIIPDYTKSILEVYKDLFLFYLKNHSLLYFLDYIEERDQSLPSWIPNMESHTRSFHQHGRSWSSTGHEVKYIATNESLQMPGIKAGKILKVWYSVPHNATPTELLALCRSAEPPGLLESSYQEEKSNMYSYVSVLNTGDLIGSKKKHISTYIKCVREGRLDLNPAFCNRLRTNLPGRVVVSTQDGAFGLCPLSAMPGDHIYLTPGSRFPLVLRPVGGILDNFRILGECYISGLMDGQTILGRLESVKANPPGIWESRLKSVDGYNVLCFRNGEKLTQKDPRLWPLPDGWHEIYWTQDGTFHSDEISPDGTLRSLVFENSTTGEKTPGDPRMTSKALKERGHHVQDLVII
jgi:hypothetical protein